MGLIGSAAMVSAAMVSAALGIRGISHDFPQLFTCRWDVKCACVGISPKDTKATKINIAARWVTKR